MLRGGELDALDDDLYGPQLVQGGFQTPLAAPHFASIPFSELLLSSHTYAESYTMSTVCSMVLSTSASLAADSF